MAAAECGFRGDVGADPAHSTSRWRPSHAQRAIGRGHEHGDGQGHEHGHGHGHGREHGHGHGHGREHGSEHGHARCAHLSYHRGVCRLLTLTGEGMIDVAHVSRTLHMESPPDVARAAARLARGDVVAHGFANLYALTTMPDASTVRATNSLKGRPVGQVGSVTTTPSRMTSLWDLAALPPGLSSDAVHALLDALYGLGPCGFRGPAAEHVPRHLTSTDGGRATVQLIAPGYACPSNRFLAAALAVAQTPFLHITSANRSRHVTGATDEPAHSRAEALRAEVATVPRVVLLEHDEDAARVRYPRHVPMSTTVLALDRTGVAAEG